MFADAPLIDINLSNNAMGDGGFSRVECMFAQAPLQCLNLSDCGLDTKSDEPLLEWFVADNKQIAGSMTHLVLDRNVPDIEGVQAVGEMIGHCKNLQHFSFVGCRTQESSNHIANSLLKTVTAAATAADIIRGHPLRRLELGDCSIADDGPAYFVALAEALQKCRNLVYLDLPDDSFGIAGILMILEALTQSGVQLTHLGLDCCELCELCEDEATVLAIFLETQATSLTTFKCSDNELGDIVVPIPMEPFGLSNCPLRELHLEGNDLGQESVKALVRARLTFLGKLNLGNNEKLTKTLTTNLRDTYGNILILDKDDEEDNAMDDASQLSAAMPPGHVNSAFVKGFGSIQLDGNESESGQAKKPRPSTVTFGLTERQSILPSTTIVPENQHVNERTVTKPRRSRRQADIAAKAAKAAEAEKAEK